MTWGTSPSWNRGVCRTCWSKSTNGNKRKPRISQTSSSRCWTSSQRKEQRLLSASVIPGSPPSGQNLWSVHTHTLTCPWMLPLTDAVLGAVPGVTADISRKFKKVRSHRPSSQIVVAFLRNWYNLSVMSFQWFMLLLIYLATLFYQYASYHRIVWNMSELIYLLKRAPLLCFKCLQ